MQIPVKVLVARLEAEKSDNWEGKLLLWENEAEQLADDTDITHVKWESSNPEDRGIYSARKILGTAGKRCWSKKHKKAFYLYKIKDLLI